MKERNEGGTSNYEESSSCCFEPMSLLMKCSFPGEMNKVLSRPFFYAKGRQPKSINTFAKKDVMVIDSRTMWSACGARFRSYTLQLVITISVPL